MPKQLTPEDLAQSGTEHGHQAALFYWAAQNKLRYPMLARMYAIPNGFFSSAGQKAKMKAEGLINGVPDIFLPYPHKGCYGLYIELKVGKNTPNDEQIDYINYLKEVGYACFVCYSWIEARNIILKYLNEE